jgi:hypothetical protein
MTASIPHVRGAQISQKYKSYFKIPVANSVAWSKFRTEDPQILGSQ